MAIDAQTQPGYDGHPLIVLDGEGTPGQTNCLTITAGNSTVDGLAINRFGGSGIVLQGGSGNQIRGDVIGADAPGTSALGNALDGVLIDGSSFNTIGGTGEGDGNLISGNGRGIEVTENASGVKIQGNRIGTNAAGTAAIPNTDDGIDVDATGTLIAANTARFNGDWGIEAVPGVVDGGGNRASGNGRPAQCLNVTCQP